MVIVLKNNNIVGYYDGMIHANSEHDIRLINACLNANVDKADEYHKLKDRLHAPYGCKRGTTDLTFELNTNVTKSH